MWLQIITPPIPSYSPDLAPSDFCLFPLLKEHLLGTQFSTHSDVIERQDKQDRNTEAAETME